MVSVLLSQPLNKVIKETEPGVHITEVSVLLSQLLNKDIKATEPSAHITEVSVLLSHLLNKRYQRDRVKCLHYRGVCFTTPQ